MMRKSFLNRQSTAISLLYKPVSAAVAIGGARSAECDGADGIALELSRIPQEERTLETFKGIINSVQLPFMFIDYRDDVIHGADDEARQKDLLLAADAGAEVIDVVGDLYDPSPRELTRSPAAIARQKELIEEIHRKGAKVLMSSHAPLEFLTAEEVLAQLQEQASRGADILKIVVRTETQEEMLEAVRTMMLLHERLEKPFVFLGSGKFGRFIRYTGLQLGVAIEFAVHDYVQDPYYHQPTISSFKAVRDNFQWHLANLPR